MAFKLGTHPYGLPWVLHEDQIATMLKGVTRLTPPAFRQDKRKPVNHSDDVAHQGQDQPDQPL